MRLTKRYSERLSASLNLALARAETGTGLRGRPPSLPFSRTAAVFAGDLARPPFLPREAAALFLLITGGAIGGAVIVGAGFVDCDQVF